MKELKKEILHGLKNLEENDKDIRTLVIWCNPNNIRGADRDLRPKVLEILEDLKKKGIVTRKKKKLSVYTQHHSKKEYELWSLIINYINSKIIPDRLRYI